MAFSLIVTNARIMQSTIHCDYEDLEFPGYENPLKTCVVKSITRQLTEKKVLNPDL